MFNRQINLAWIGNLGNVGFNFVKLLNKYYIEASVYIPKDSFRKNTPGNPDYEYEGASKEKFVNHYNRYLVLNYLLRKVNLEISIAKNLSSVFKKHNIIQAQTGNEIIANEISRINNTPFVALPTGADLSELAFSKTKDGSKYRNALQNAKHIFLVNINQFGYIDKLQLNDIPHSFLPFNINASNFQFSENIIKNKLIIFSIARLDWKSKSRKSTKRNDIFFRGFAEFVNNENKKDFELVIADWGIDRKETYRLIKKLGIGHITKFISPGNKKYFYEIIKSSNIIVDQFNLGAIGLGALESMAMSKPVFAYCNEGDSKVAYGNVIPVINTRNEEDVFRYLKLMSENYIKKKSEESFNWVQKHHSEEKIFLALKEVYQKILL